MNVIKSVLDNDAAGLKEMLEKKISEKLENRINDKQVEILAKMNKTTVENQRSIMDNSGK
jgi:hypothetical protein